MAAEAVGLLTVAADPVRWRLLAHLAANGTTCVCNLQPVAAVAGNLLSYHLKVLREACLVTTARRGRWVDYSLAEDALDRLNAALPGVAVPNVAVPNVAVPNVAVPDKLASHASARQGAEVGRP